MEDSRVEVSSPGFGGCGGRGDAVGDRVRGWREEKRGRLRESEIKRESGIEREREREGEMEKEK